jgi:hypothetical protein
MPGSARGGAWVGDHPGLPGQFRVDEAGTSKGCTLRKLSRRQARSTLAGGAQTGAEWDGQARKRCKSKPRFRLQLDFLQELASDGFVPRPAIEPNHDMCSPGKPLQLVSTPIRE